MLLGALNFGLGKNEGLLWNRKNFFFPIRALLNSTSVSAFSSGLWSLIFFKRCTLWREGWLMNREMIWKKELQGCICQQDLKIFLPRNNFFWVDKDKLKKWKRIISISFNPFLWILHIVSALMEKSPWDRNQLRSWLFPWVLSFRRWG